jgi:hypothetical protein
MVPVVDIDADEGVEGWRSVVVGCLTTIARR